MQRLIDTYHAQIARYCDEACARVLASGNPFYTRIPGAALRAAVKRAFEATGQDLVRGEPYAYPRLMEILGAQRSAEGVKCQDMLAGLGMGFDTVSELLAAEHPEDLELQLAWESARARIAEAGAAALADAYLEARERVVRAQAEEILELSVRVLPLFRGVLLLPLVGRLDAARAERVLEALLGAVVSHGSRVVLLDLSGLPSVDLDVAAHLSRAASAVRLLGAEPALVGIRASLASAMVTGGIELGGVATLSTLEEGILHARRVMARVA